MRILNRKSVLSCFAALSIICMIAISAAAENDDGDCATTHGDYLGKNYVFAMGPNEGRVVGDRLYMYASPDLKSEPIHVLASGDTVELLDTRPDALLVSDAIGSMDGDVTYMKGWVDARFVIESADVYVAMHPTAVYVSPNTDAKMIMMLDTYYSLPVVEEYDAFYCVLLSPGVGYVVKE